METEIIRSLSKGQKIALWIAIVWLIFCILGALSDGGYYLLIVCIALLAAIICLFIRKLDAKYAWAVFATSLILPFVMIGALNSPETEKVKQEVEQPKETLKSEETKKTTKETTEKIEKKQEPQLSPKEKEIAKAGYERGALFGMAGSSNEEFSNMLDIADYFDELGKEVDNMYVQMAGQEYDNAYTAPTNAEEEKLRKIYIEHFLKAFNSAMDAMGN